MNFKQWLILSEELYLQNNTATIFHRTKSFERVQGMMNGGFTAGVGAFHGPGLYTTYTLEGTTNLGYGNYVVKLKVNNLKEYFVLEPDVAKKIHGDNYKLKDQARILKLTLKLTDEQWQKYQEISENGKFGSAAASKALKDGGHKLWQHKCKGIVYNGEQDGKCICVYAPYEGLQFLAYAYAPTPTTVDFIEKNWVKSGRDASIRSISDLKFPKDTGIGSTSVEKQYDLEKEKVIPSQILDDVFKGKYVKLKFYLKNNKLSGNNVYDLLYGASDKEKMAEILGSDNINKINSENVSYLLSGASDKDKMINLIIKYKTELSVGDVHNFIHYADDKEKMAEILGPDNINKLTDIYVYILLSRASDKYQMAEILGQENINKLNNSGVYSLLRYASDIERMAKILRQENIDKLSDNHVSTLLNSASDKDKMVEILGQDNINKLTGQNVFDLLATASDKDQMARILGTDNINKLSGKNIFNLPYIASSKKEMKQILRKYYTGKDTNIISLINQ